LGGGLIHDDLREEVHFTPIACGVRHRTPRGIPA